MSPAAPQAQARETLLAAAFFLAWTAVATWPQVLRMDDALSDFGDAKLNARILQWDFAQTIRDPAQLFQLTFFHPAREVLAFSENLYGVALFGFPLLAAGASAVLNYNVLLLLGMWLSALGAWALARRVTRDPLASVAAGVIYAFGPWRMEQIPHIQHQWGAFLCLLLLFLLRFLEDGRKRDLILYAVAFAWNALANVHYALFSGLLVALTLAWAWLIEIPERASRLRAAALATVAGGLVFLPFAAGYRAAAKLYGFRRYIGEIQTYSGWWTDFLSAGTKNFFWGPMTVRWRMAERDFFPGVLALLLAGAAIALLWKAPIPSPEDTPKPKRRTAFVRIADVLIAVLALAWLVALLRPGLAIGPLRLGDPGRILVVAAVVAFLRLATAFPESRYRNLGDFLRRGPLPPQATLFLAIGAVGILVALGLHTPFYRFLVQSFGFIFRAIRAPARGIVLSHIALAVLAAWGLSLLLRRGFLLRSRSAAMRTFAMAGVLAVLAFEYRAFPLELFPEPSAPSAVYRWMRASRFPGGAVEWPLGLPYDCDYLLNQAFHEKPIVNGYSGFFPAPYADLVLVLKKRPIPGSDIWPRLRALDASLLVYHAHEGRGIQANAYARAVRNGVEDRELELLGSFPHEGLGRDFVYRLAGSPEWNADLKPDGTPPPEAARLFEAAAARLDVEVKRLAPPFGYLPVPAEGQRVAPGFWAYGWTLDDSGIAGVRVTADGGGAPIPVAIGRPWPHLSELYPDYVYPGNGGYGFAVPDLPPGRHTLRVTMIGRDGGETTIERSIIVE